MSIAKNSVVNFHYRLSETGGEELETTRGGDPVLFLVGYKNLLEGLDKAFEGKSQGDVFTVSLTAENAYGLRRDDATMRVPQKHLNDFKKLKNKLRPGMKVSLNTEHGPRDVIVVKAGKFNVDIDINHPYAGKDLNFDIEIIDVREGTDDEITHGHAHGVGGHHH
jgi:FKBP-type peptidyl-prolyl cis-trans isomerase SlyD